MAQIIIDIPDAQFARVKDAFATRFSWDGNTPNTKAGLVRKKCAEFVREVVRDEEIRQAQLAAAAAVTPVDPT